jgi:hypothetical protein
MGKQGGKIEQKREGREMSKRKIDSRIFGLAVMISGLFLFIGFTNMGAAINTNPEQIVIKPEQLGNLRPIFVKLLKEKIRFGYSSANWYRSPDEPTLPESLPAVIDASKYRFDMLRQMAEAGFNGVILLFGGWKGGPAEEIAGEFPRFEPMLRLWAEGCKRYNLYLMVCIQYGLVYQPLKTYRRFYDGAGKEAKQAICPRDWDYWQEEILKLSSIIAKVAKEYPNVLIGENIDFEMYISDFSRYPGPCMCDVCFGDFMKEFAPGIDWKTIPAKERRDWLKINDLMPLYARFMEREVYNIATKVEKAVHQINPDFVFSYFPTFEWLPGITRGLGTPEQPVIIFSENEYTAGFSPATVERKQRIEKEGYPALYCPGIWLLQHNPKNIPSHLYQMALATAGYWIYEIHPSLLSDKESTEGVLYKGSTRQEYWDAFRLANTAIQEYLKKGPSYRPPFPLLSQEGKERPKMKVFYTTESPHLDGKLNDPCWTKAKPIILRNNSTGKIYIPITVARITYDDKYLYFAVQCDEPEMDKLKAVIKEYNDFNLFNDDVIEIFLDTTHNMSSCFHVGINALGTVAEHQLYGMQEDRSWQSGVCVVSARRLDGWDLEMAFPLDRLVNNTHLEGKVWGVNINRKRAIPGISGKDRLAAWSPTFGLFNEPSRFGEITFVRTNFVGTNASAGTKEFRRITAYTGYLLYHGNTDHTGYLREAELLRQAGFNAIDIKFHGSYTIDDTAEKYIRKVAANLSEKGLLFTICLYPGYTYPDGTEGDHHRRPGEKFPPYVGENGQEDPTQFCLFNESVWVDRLYSRVFHIAKISVDSPIDAVTMDLETIHNPHPCYCDSCWQKFIKSAQLGPQIGKLPASERYRWLKEHNLVEKYASFSEELLGEIIRKFEKKVHAINPRLKLGLMPLRDDLFTRSFIKNLGTKEAPVIVNSWIMYNGLGFTKEVEKEKSWVKSIAPNSIYIPWFRINNYYPKDLAIHAYYAAINTDGYNMWTLRMLTSPYFANRLGDKTYHLPLGTTQEEYWAALKMANEEIIARLQKGEKYQTKLVLSPPKPVAPPIDMSLWKPAEQLIPLAELNELPEYSTPPTTYREIERFLVYIPEQGGKVEFILKHLAGSARPNSLSWLILNPRGIPIADGVVAPGSSETISKSVEEKGTYTVIVNGGIGGAAWYSVEILSPYYVVDTTYLHIFVHAREQYFYVPVGVKKFTIEVGVCEPEVSRIKILSPLKETVVDETLSKPTTLTISVPQGYDGKVWSFLIERPENLMPPHYYQDTRVKLKDNHSPYVSDHPQRLLIRP